MNVVLKSLQLIIGTTIGLASLGALVGGAGYYFFVTQMSTRPPKPVFAEERQGYKPSLAAKPKSTLAAKPKQSPVVKDPNAIEKLPANAYNAKVVWQNGLSLKQEPDAGAAKIGSVAFNAKVAIIKTTNDRQWVLIRSATDNLQGWVKAGNIDKSAAAARGEQTTTPPQPKVKPGSRTKPRANAAQTQG